MAGTAVAAVARVTPILHATDAVATAEWYAPMGFAVATVYKPQDDWLAFVTLKSPRDDWLFVSEHTGDARPDTLVYFHVDDREAVDAVARAYGVEACAWEWGTYEAHLTDPAGNRVRVGCGA